MVFAGWGPPTAVWLCGSWRGGVKGRAWSSGKKGRVEGLMASTSGNMLPGQHAKCIKMYAFGLSETHGAQMLLMILLAGNPPLPKHTEVERGLEISA